MADIGVRFYVETVQNEAKSREAGRPIFDEIEMVEVLVPGDRNFRPVFMAHEIKDQPDQDGNPGRTWAEVYSKAYAEFRDGNSVLSSGTPLEQVTFLTRARVSELRALGITSVEQLATLSDRNRGRLGPDARPLMEQAQAFLDAAADAATPTRLAVENAEMRDRLAQMEAMMAEMMATREAGHDDDPAPVKRGPGRPRKAETDATA